MPNPPDPRKQRESCGIGLGIFFSHPTQHQSVMFQRLSEDPRLDVRVFYYDPGALGAMYDPGYGTNAAWDIDLLAGTRSVVLHNWLRGRQVSPLRQFNPAVNRAMRHGRFDAVFLSGYISPSNWLVLLMARRSGAHVLYFSDSNVLDEQRKPQPWPRRVFRRQFLNRVDTFLTIGDKNRATYLDLGYDENKMTWCPYPVDVKRFEAARSDTYLPSKLAALRQKYDIPLGTHVVGFCGKLIERKRPADIVAAVRMLQRDDVYALLIGSGPLEGSLRESLRPNDRIRITGFVNQGMIPYVMLMADVGVVASEWDAHPLVTTEFAACGLPVIVSHLCGVSGEHDVLRPGENGLVYTCGKVEELAAHVSTILSDDVLRQRMGARSLELAAKQSADYAAKVIADHLVTRNRALVMKHVAAE